LAVPRGVQSFSLINPLRWQTSLTALVGINRDIRLGEILKQSTTTGNLALAFGKAGTGAAEVALAAACCELRSCEQYYTDAAA
jgi:hypothetical protein